MPNTIHGKAMFFTCIINVLLRLHPYRRTSFALLSDITDITAKTNVLKIKHGARQSNISGSAVNLKIIMYKAICSENRYERKNIIIKHRYDVK